MGTFSLAELSAHLESLYQRYHLRVYRGLDPVEVVWGYSEPLDQEIAGLWAALFAWGRRDVAIRKVRTLLELAGCAPSEFVRQGLLWEHPFVHRTWKADDVQAFWRFLTRIYAEWGSLKAFFLRYSSLVEGVAAFQSAAIAFYEPMRYHVGDLRRGSASKRLFLWLRWMIRRDEIDPGPWAGAFLPAQLYVPLDVHVLRWARGWGLSLREPPSWQGVQVLTAYFRALRPADPLRYDFALVTASALHKVVVPSYSRPL